MYIYPSNLTAKASLFFWQLRDVVVAIILTALGAVAMSITGSPALLAVAAAYALLSIRFEEVSVLDYMMFAWRFCVARQQFYVWRCENEDSK